MNIAVCIKQTPATDTRIRISNNVSIDTNDVTFVLNPYDEIAVEEALRVKEKHGGETTCITVGPPKAAEALRTCLAMGIDKAIHIKTDKITGPDSLAVASALAEVIKKNSYDIIFAGKQAVDDDNAAVGIELASILNIPHVSIITKLEIDGNKAKAHREIEGGTEIIECELPAIFTAQKGLNEPRYPSLPGIMKAKKKPLEEIEGVYSVENEKILVSELTLPAARKVGKLVTAESAIAVKELVKYLHEEIKVI